MKRVLIVEDSEYIPKAIKLILNAHRIVTEHVNDGSKVMESVKNSHYDLIILDLMMPGVSGKDVFLMLKKDEKTKKIPILILTARTDSLKWEPELQGCDKFMTKPFDNDELVAEVKKLLKIEDTKKKV